MFEKENDHLFDNSGIGQNDEMDANYPPIIDEQNRDKSDERSQKDPMNPIELERNGIHAVPKNNDFSSINDEDLDEDDDDIDLDEEEDDEEIEVEEVEEEEVDFDDEEEEDYEESNPNVHGDELPGLSNSPNQRGDEYRSQER